MTIERLVTPKNPLLARLLRGSSVVRAVDHRDGAGHLDPVYAQELRDRTRDRARGRAERAFAGGAPGAGRRADPYGQQFVESVTSGEEAGAATDDETSEERGGPFVETNARTEFAFDTDASNPVGSTREPFPTS